MEHIVSLDIGGEVFRVRKATLENIQGTLLTELDNSAKCHCFERDPGLFRHILNAYRYGLVHVPRNVCPLLFKDELFFWKIPLTMVAPCCLKHLYEDDNDIETLKILIGHETTFADNMTKEATEHIKRTIKITEHSEESVKTIDEQSKESQDAKMANSFWLFLDEPASSPAAKAWCFFYSAVVMLSVMVYIVWLDPRVRVSQYMSTNPYGLDIYSNDTLYHFLTYTYTEKALLMIFSDPHPILFALDMFCLAFFTMETIIHFIACPNKLKYFKNVYHFAKILLCIAMVISTVFEIRKDTIFYNGTYGYVYYICKSLNVIRLLLIFRLHRIYNRLHVMILSLNNSCKELGLLLFSFFIAVLMYGCMIFSAEIDSTMFESTYISLWWSLITMTTIGYGDFYPTTTLGYIVGVICAVNGIIVLALPIAAIAGTFSNLFARNADYQRHKETAIKQMKLNKKSQISSVKDENTINTMENIDLFVKDQNILHQNENIDLCSIYNDNVGDVKPKQVNESHSECEPCNLPTVNC